MPLWICDFQGCSKPSVRKIGDCALCNRHLCSDHVRPEFHRCPLWKDADAYDPAAWAAEEHELQNLMGVIDTDALRARASRARGGVPCSIPLLRFDRGKRSSFMGGMNYHVEVHFDDGVTWIARIRRFNATSPPAAVRDHIIQSEVATLKFLESTGVPAPKVHDFAIEGPDNAVKVGFILMDKLAGKSLRWSIATTEQREKVMTQVADIFIELRKHPFDAFGSLDRPGEKHVGAFAQESLTDLVGSELRVLGPCSSLEEYHSSTLRFTTELILRDELYSRRPVDAYLIHRFLMDLIPKVLPSEPEDDDEFYLKHADDKGDHLLVDDDYNVTGIIDWEWAHTAPAALAFNSPIGFLPVGDFYDGLNEIGSDEATFARLLEEKGQGNLARIVRTGRLQHRFAFCCGYDLEDWDGFKGLFQGLRDAVGVDHQLDWDAWREAALRRYVEDPGLKQLLARQQEPPLQRS